MKMARVETAIRLGLDFFKAYNQREVSRMADLIGAECIFESSDPAPDGTICKGKDAITRYWESYFQDNPDVRIEIEDALGLGNLCVVWWKRYGDLIADENAYIRGVDIFRTKDDRISEQTSYIKG
ncbi:MAG: nuclear transport factor 2 family protein [Candidatus Promineifilaceae bacterium]|jgi:predicted SnoaL-like aldol condensation-catalyzing enzyme